MRRRKVKKLPRKPYAVGEVTSAIAHAQGDFEHAFCDSLDEHVALSALTLLGAELVRSVAGYRESL